MPHDDGPINMASDLPEVKGEYLFNFHLKKLSFWRVGGPCDVMFYPRDVDDLSHFLRERPKGMNILPLGKLSNVLILDGGFRGCIVNLSKFMRDVSFSDGLVDVLAGSGMSEFIMACANKGLKSCEKLFSIPGSVGGAISMNAGVPDFEICIPLVSVSCVDMTSGEEVILENSEIGMSYRNGNIPKNFIVTSAKLVTQPGDKNEIRTMLDRIKDDRMRAQPIGQHTCGSTFKNPHGMKAWKLIREAGCGNMKIGGAAVSTLHANFLINTGGASSSDFVGLINTIKQRVFENSGIMLEEEVVIIGNEKLD
jgi:UDP-N-acetylmuramate dehydrogenase